MSELKSTDTLKGIVQNVVYRNENNDYTVFELTDEDDNLVTAVGIIPGVTEGETVVLEGQWAYHKEFGRQFSFVRYDKSLPDEIEGIIQYLSSRTVKGVGPVTAVKIVNKFGLDTFDVIENHPEWLTDIAGISMKKAAVISESFKAQTELRGVMIFFKDYIGTGEVTKVYKRLGASAIGVVRDNPYILCAGEYGIPFEKADAMAAAFGFAPDSDQRVLSGIGYMLDYNAAMNGHTCLPKDKLISAAAQFLSIEENTVTAKLDEYIKARDFYEYTADDVCYVMTADVYVAEEYISMKMKSLGDELIRISAYNISSLIEKVERKHGVEYANLQREAIFRCLNSGVTVITGGPGTGKTTVVKGIISIFTDLDIKTVLAAPTGRAAKRLSETTGEVAKTVHRLLEMDRTSESEARFNRNSQNPIDEKVIIIDEASMIDLSLMNCLMRALPRGARLILIGDADQLPSVGAGNVLADLIDSGVVDTVRLTEIFRQSSESLIVTNAHKINNGEPPIINITDSDFFFVNREDERDIPATIADLITRRLPKTYGRDIVEQIQVVTPSKKGNAGVEILNLELQKSLNPQAQLKKEKAAHGVIFREGDRVMQIANNYELEWMKNGVVGYGIFNGDIGRIENINYHDEEVLISFDERTVKYPFANLDELELSYAITVHKSQGSEYPVVIIPLYSCAPLLMTRNLFYTAVTRARRMVILVGRSEMAFRMVKNNRIVMRYTTFKHRLTSKLQF